MAKLPRDCPECHTPLGVARVKQTGKVRCPECGIVITPERDDDHDSGARIQAKTGAPRPAARPATRKRSPEADDAPPVRTGNGLLIGLICGGLALGFLALLVVVGGVALFFISRPGKPPVVAAAYTEEASGPMVVAPVANPNPNPVPVPPVNPPPVQPPKDPIKAVAGVLPLDDLKAASVYIKAKAGNLGSTGSGFVFRAQGDTVYVVTNHHVVTPTVDAPFGPRRRPFGMAVVELTAVFRSGTAQEQSLKAALVGDDREADLAVLKVTGVTDPPRPIDYEKTPKLVETMPVLAFGFPFGAALDPKQKNPAITVTRGAVSALRLDRGELSEVQLDLDLNPGNSGGPVVDEKGNLVGVAVAKVKNSRIGFAVPVLKLDRMMEGRIEPPSGIQTLTSQGQTQVRVFVRIADPLGKLRNPTLLYGPADGLKSPAQGKNGWEALAGAKTSPLKIEGANAVAVLALTPPAKGELKILMQAAYENASGRTVYGEPKTMSLGAPGAATPSGPAAGEELTKLLADLQSPDEPTRQKAADALAKGPPRERLAEVKLHLQSLLTAADAATRLAGVKALVACDPKEAPAALVMLLEDASPPVRIAVLQVLKERPDARFAGPVAARLATDGAVASEALKAIGPAAEPAVLPYLTDKDPQARVQAFLVVKEIGGAASVPALEEVIRVNGGDVGLARNVLPSVRERVPLTKAEWPAALDDLKSADAGRRTGAVRRVAATPPTDDRRADLVSRLESLLNDRSAEARAAAAKALGRWAGKDAVPVLVKRLEGFDPALHAAVLDALAETKDDAAAAAIAKRLPDAFDRPKALLLLRALDAPVAEKAVLPLLADTNVFVRTEACKALADVGGRDSIAPLERLAKENNVFYSGVAAQSVAAIKARVEGGEKK